jgi:hypothetical protein
MRGGDHKGRPLIICRKPVEPLGDTKLTNFNKNQNFMRVFYE